MTIASQSRTAGPFTGTGLLVSYPFTFKVFSTADLLIQQTDTSGVITTWSLGGNYTAALNADQNTSPGGTITPLAALPAGYSLMVTSAVSATQGASLTNAGGFFPATIENALDRLTILIQQAFNSILGVIRVPEIGGTTLLPAAAQRANKVIAFDSLGQPTVMVPASGSAADVLTQIAASVRTNLLVAGNGPWANAASGDTQHLCEIVNDRSPYQVLALSTYGLAGVVKENNIHFNRYGGSLAVPTAVQSGDYFMSCGYRGWDGTGVLSQSMAAFQYQATEVWDATHHGGRWKLELAKTGGSTTRLPAFKLYAGPTDGVVMELGDETALPTRIINASNIGFSQLHGSQDQAGAVVNLYGSGHATLPRQAQVRADVVSFQDLAGNEAFQVLAANQQVLFTGKGGFGYYQGAGTSVTQATNKSTNVAGDFPTIKVTMNAAALAANTAVSFSWNSTKIGADDHVVATIRGGATAGAYVAVVDAVFAGSARVSLRNMTGGSLSEAVVIQLSVLKGASA